MSTSQTRPDRRLGNLCGRIARGYDPERIALFGSAAQGTVREASDIDLPVVKDTAETAELYLDRVLTVSRVLGLDVGADVIVLTPGELAKAIQENRYFIAEDVRGRGVVLYEPNSERPTYASGCVGPTRTSAGRSTHGVGSSSHKRAPALNKQSRKRSTRTFCRAENRLSGRTPCRNS
jgi:predicted nucleotidyltransferase